MNKRPRSLVWNYFTKDDNPEYAICTIAGCKTKIKQTCGNTSNLLKHLRTKHIKEHEECVKDIKANEEKRKKQKQINSQPTIEQTISRTHVYPKESVRKKKTD